MQPHDSPPDMHDHDVVTDRLAARLPRHDQRPAVAPGGHPNRNSMTPAIYDPIYWEGKHLLMNLLNIEVPVISALVSTLRNFAASVSREARCN